MRPRIPQSYAKYMWLEMAVLHGLTADELMTDRGTPTALKRVDIVQNRRHPKLLLTAS
jgi:hypothetical protein